MAKRNRGFPQSHSTANLLGESNSSPTPPSPSSNFLSFPRSASPSSITGFFTKPSKWFSRPSPKGPPSPGSQDLPRISNGSGPRKATISGPTDPRPIPPPIPPTMNSAGRMGASRSVFDLSLSHAQTNGGGIMSPGREGLGELRNVSRKGWSRSVDDLGRYLSTQPQALNMTSVQVSASPPRGDSAESPTKVMIEAYRRNSPSPHSLHPNYPFPTMRNNPSVPPTGTQNRAIPDIAASPAHGRSYSHAPFQSSKLASPSSLSAEQTFPSPISPSSQTRNRTISSFEREREKARRTGFSFPISSGGTSNKPPQVITPSLAGADALNVKPASLHPKSESKRTSQIVHHSGFINRHPDIQLTHRTGGALVTGLAKGWKPYKAILKGSKLYFYKPPSDRSVAVKELFPQGMEAAVDERPEIVQEEYEPPGRGTGNERWEVKKRTRLYRGRASHPELSVGNDGSVTKASSDALIHEAVFGTSFAHGDSSETERRWEHFASAIVLCLPRLIGKAKFEGEFIRYASYLINGADEADRAQLQHKAMWLSEKYLLYQGGPSNETTWATFRAEYAPRLSPSTILLSAPVPKVSSDMNTCPSIVPPTLALQYNDDATPALTATPRPSLSRPSLSHTRSSRENLWAALEKDGLTNDVFINFDSALIAQSLSAFHRSLLTYNDESFFGASLIDHETADGGEAQLAILDNSPLVLFFGSEEQPQWLTRLIVVQVLNATGAAADAPHSFADATSQVSKTHLRAELISKWVRIGEHCRAAGDQCSWRAIQAALCSRPIARLDRTWRRVESTALRSVQAWIKDATQQIISEQWITPWGGNVREHVADLLQKARLESPGKDDYWNVASLEQILDCVEPVAEAFSSFNKNIGLDEQDDDVSRFTRVWKTLSEQPPPRSSSLNYHLAQSLAAEPHKRGRFEPYHWQRPLNVPTVHTLVPLLFVEPLPTATLINRNLIYRGKKDSMETSFHPNLDIAQVSRITHLKPHPEVRRNAEMKGPDFPLLVSSGEDNGPVLRLYDGELLLMVPKGLPEANARPPSFLEAELERRPSQIRVSNPGLERKTSVARRSSLPSLSQRSSLALSEPTSESTLRVTVRAGTLDKLVDILVSGLEGVPVSVTDDNGEMPLREGKTRMIKLDHAEFRVTWWSVFRSFVSPLVLFELLRKRFLISECSVGVSCPAPRVRFDIFSTMTQWIENGGGALDALGDTELFESMKGFLTTASVTKLPEGTSDEDRPSWIQLENARQTTLATFTSQVSRPKPSSPLSGESPLESPSRNYGRDPPSIDDIDPETLVDNLDSLAAAALRSVTQEDFFVTIDLLEVQSVDRTGWFTSHEPNTSYDEIDIQTIYSHLQQIEPSHLISEMAQESFYKLLPPSIRGLIRAHAVIRKWVISCIVSPHLGLWKRQARAETFLQAVEVCRLRMAETAIPAMVPSQQSIRSFVETALISALVSPESRAFSFMWLNIAAIRGTGADSMTALLSKSVVKSTKYKARLTVDAGWLLERILEVISMPNIIDAEGETFSLVNFEKRRHLFDLVSSATSLTSARTRNEHAGLDRIDIDRLNRIHRDVTGPPFDVRHLKEEAYHECMTLMPQAPLPKKNQRPFLRITQPQQEKYKREKFLRERLLREKKAEQLRTEKREDDLNRAMQARHPNSQIIKHQRSRRTMSSAFFQLMRPISSAFSSDNIYASTQRRTAPELDFEPTGKPALVISLVGATVASFNNNIRLYTFHLTTEDGGRYLLQASTRSDLASWLTAINKTAKSSTAKRLTYIANIPKPQLSDHIQAPSQTSARHPTKVFGVDLEFLLQREAGGKIPPGAVPRVLERCLSEIETRGLQEVGLYRVPGASSAIHALKEEFDVGGEITFFSQDYVDIWAVCDIVKSFFRELPHPIFPEKSYFEVLRVIKIPEFEERLMAVRDVVHRLPIHNFYVLRRICEHLERVTDYEETNHMTAQALSVLFNPSLMRSPLDNFGVTMQNMTYTSQLLQTLIVHFHQVFDEAEADMDQDDEVETQFDNATVDLQRVDSHSSSVPTDAIHDHDPDLEPLPTASVMDHETLDAFP